MNLEQLEFAISQYLDGSLPAAETAALEARLNEDAGARELLEEYRKVDTLLKAPAALPVVAWEKLSAHLSNAVNEAEQFEFAISQHADGTLPADQAASVEARLHEDAAARELLGQHRKLNDLLKSPAALPAIRWEKLAEHLSHVVADAAEPPSIKLFPNRWVRGATRLAIAACVLLASSVGIHSYLAHRGGTGVPVPIVIGPSQVDPTQVAMKPIVVQIGGAETQTLQGPAVATITIGAGPGAGADDSPAFAEGIITTSPRSLIASNAATAQDSTLMPY
jgi:anti-sigma factor RsiW